MGLDICPFSNFMAVKDSGLNCRVGSNPTSPANFYQLFYCESYIYRGVIFM